MSKLFNSSLCCVYATCSYDDELSKQEVVRVCCNTDPSEEGTSTLKFCLRAYNTDIYSNDPIHDMVDFDVLITTDTCSRWFIARGFLIP
jgi:hypothetical protein